MFPSVITDAERNSVITLSGCCARTVRADSKTNRVNVKSFLIRRNVFLPDLFDGFDAVAGEVDAEALELGGVVVLVLEDEV